MSLPERGAILKRVGEWSELVDRAIATGVHRHVGRIGEWDTFEWQASLGELLKLSGSTDAYYDRPTIGPAYALWYHARRVNPLVSQLERIIRLADRRRHRQVDVVDLGAGTGALAWAAALVAGAIVELGGEPPNIVVHEVESSPLMTDTADSLWATLGEELDAFGFVERIPQPVSWPLAEVDSDAPVWLLASFLLDHTDKNRAEEMAKSLHQVVDRCHAEGVVFTVTSSKKGIATTAIDQLEAEHKWEGQRRQAPLQWSGPMSHTAAMRRDLYTSFGLGASALLKKLPTFDGDSLSVREATRPIGDQAALFNTDAWMALTDEQEQAVGIDLDRSVLALGAAGSGKSIVVIERLVRLVTRQTVGAPRRILVTTFNNGMVGQLDRWIKDRLRHEGVRFDRRSDRDHIIFSNVGSGRDSIELVNWDKVTKRLLEINGDGVASWRWSQLAEKEVLRLRADARFERIAARDRVADLEFLRAEQWRVVYGLGALTRADYQTVERTGRGRAIGPVQKEFAWAVMEAVGPDVFLSRRIEMLERARAGRLPKRYTDVYVDEVQDFTPADIECLLAMHDGTGAVLYAGDEAQALHLGLSYRRPRPVHGTWVQGRIVRLEGSHRLPVPIARAVGPLVDAASELRTASGQSADDFSRPQSRKASVIGVRPILVVGDEAHLAAEIRRTVETYGGYLEAEFGKDRITVCESDPALARAIGTPKIECATVMAIKGLERGMVVWSARRPPANAGEALETAYTVMTRTSCLLVLAVDPENLPTAHLDVIRHLDHDHVMRWNKRAEDWWRRVVLGAERTSLRSLSGPAPSPESDSAPNDPDDPAAAPEVDPRPGGEESWDDGGECMRHELSWCSLCKPRDLPRTVSVTRGRSDAFHETATCPALVSGQRLVEAAGGTAADIETVALEAAIGLGKFPCLVCLPAAKGKL
jgi:hypothetical protein